VSTLLKSDMPRVISLNQLPENHTLEMDVELIREAGGSETGTRGWVSIYDEKKCVTIVVREKCFFVSQHF